MSVSQEARRAEPERLLAGRYRLLERVDRGGAGTVWRGRDLRLDRDVAIKVLGSEADDAFRLRFTDEARRAAAISHPNVVAVYDEGRDGADAFMVMEYVRGRSLRDLVAARGALSPGEAARIVAQIAAALDAAHAAGVLHCDVKPANVIVDASGTAKLTDFGIARAARDPEERELVGTARYIAPERIEGKAATVRGDVYGLGLVAYELLAGQSAYGGADTDDVLRRRLAGPPAPLRSVRVGLPPDVDAVVARALARDPKRRYASAGQLATALAAAALHGDATTPLLPPARALRQRRWAWPRLDSVVALIAILVVLLGVVALFANVTPLPAGRAATTPAASAGAVTLRAPNVVGRGLDEAIAQLRGAGFGLVSWDVAQGSSGAACTVVRQEPAAGATFARGQSAEVLYVPGKDCVRKSD